MIPLDPETAAALRPGHNRVRYGREYRRVTRAWLPLLIAAINQPNPTLELCREIERIRADLPEELQP